MTRRYEPEQLRDLAELTIAWAEAATGSSARLGAASGARHLVGPPAAFPAREGPGVWSPRKEDTAPWAEVTLPAVTHATALLVVEVEGAGATTRLTDLDRDVVLYEGRARMDSGPRLLVVPLDGPAPRRVRLETQPFRWDQRPRSVDGVGLLQSPVEALERPPEPEPPPPPPEPTVVELHGTLDAAPGTTALVRAVRRTGFDAAAALHPERVRLRLDDGTVVAVDTREAALVGPETESSDRAPWREHVARQPELARLFAGAATEEESVLATRRVVGPARVAVRGLVEAWTEPASGGFREGAKPRPALVRASAVSTGPLPPAREEEALRRDGLEKLTLRGPSSRPRQWLWLLPALLAAMSAAGTALGGAGPFTAGAVAVTLWLADLALDFLGRSAAPPPFLRGRNERETRTPWENERWLVLDALLIAGAVWVLMMFEPVLEAIPAVVRGALAASPIAARRLISVLSTHGGTLWRGLVHAFHRASDEATSGRLRLRARWAGGAPARRTERYTSRLERQTQSGYDREGYYRRHTRYRWEWLAYVVQTGLKDAAVQLGDGSRVALPDAEATHLHTWRSGANEWEAEVAPGEPVLVFARFLQGMSYGRAQLVFGSALAYRLRVSLLLLAVLAHAALSTLPLLAARPFL
jgi:hypothetical protein